MLFFYNRNQRESKTKKRGDCFGEKTQASKEPIPEPCDNLYEEHLQENLTLTQIAREAGLSESYLNAVFKECIKCAPMDYYINMKMEQACYLLCNTDLHIYQVAQHLGYENQYYFSRAFKKVLGVPPKKYKEMPGIPAVSMQVSC